MELIEKKSISFEEIANDNTTPKILYKFRDWRNDFHKRLLTDLEVYFASPRDFEDENDCKIPVRYDLLSNLERKAWIKHLVNLGYSKLSRPERRKLVKDKYKEKRLRDKQYLLEYEERSFENFCNCFGVFSLCGNLKNQKLWDYYAPIPEGFVVGLDTRIIFPDFGGGGPVQYVDNIPVIKPEPIMSSHTQMAIQFYSKLENWRWEEEYRTIISGQNLTVEQRRRKLQAVAIKEIWVSEEAPQSLINEIEIQMHDSIKDIPVNRLKL